MSINNITSIFRLEEIRSYDSEEHWYRDASIGIVGHYSSLEKVMKAIRENNQETWDAEEIMAYLVKEIPVDNIWGEVDCLSIRSLILHLSISKPATITGSKSPFLTDLFAASKTPSILELNRR